MEFEVTAVEKPQAALKVIRGEHLFFAVHASVQVSVGDAVVLQITDEVRTEKQESVPATLLTRMSGCIVEAREGGVLVSHGGLLLQVTGPNWKQAVSANVQADNGVITELSLHPSRRSVRQRIR